MSIWRNYLPDIPASTDDYGDTDGSTIDVAIGDPRIRITLRSDDDDVWRRDIARGVDPDLTVDAKGARALAAQLIQTAELSEAMEARWARERVMCECGHRRYRHDQPMSKERHAIECPCPEFRPTDNEGQPEMQPQCESVWNDETTAWEARA